MYFTDALRVLIRQLPVVLFGLALTALACAGIIRIVPTAYQTSSQMLLLPPADPIPEGEPVNPYLNLPGSLTLTATLLAGGVMTPDAQASLASEGFDSTYAVSVLPQTGPLLLITVKGTDPEAILATRDSVLERISSDLNDIQRTEDVPDEQLIVSRPFAVAAEAEVLAGNRLRALAVVGLLGGVLTLFAAFSLDRWRRHRPKKQSTRRRARRVGTADAELPEFVYPPADSPDEPSPPHVAPSVGMVEESVVGADRATS